MDAMRSCTARSMAQGDSYTERGDFYTDFYTDFHTDLLHSVF